jgi:hypothetical protein
LCRTEKDFIERNSKHPEIEKEAAKIRFNHFEQLRQAKLDAVCKEREMILKEEQEEGSFSTNPRHHGPKSAFSSTKTTTNSPINLPPPQQQQQQRRAQSARGWKNQSSISDVQEQENTIMVSPQQQELSISFGCGAEASTILKLEEKRLERIKRRQQKEIESLVEMEIKMATIQAENTKREEEEQKKKLHLQKELRIKRSQMMKFQHQKEIEKKKKTRY